MCVYIKSLDFVVSTGTIYNIALLVGFAWFTSQIFLDRIQLFVWHLECNGFEGLGLGLRVALAHLVLWKMSLRHEFTNLSYSLIQNVCSCKVHNSNEWQMFHLKICNHVNLCSCLSFLCIAFFLAIVFLQLDSKCLFLKIAQLKWTTEQQTYAAQKFAVMSIFVDI